MANPTFPLLIVSPAKAVFSGDVEMVEVPGTEGDFGVLPGHSPLFSMIRAGAITMHQPGNVKSHYWIEGGYADVTPEGVTILAEKIRDILYEEVQAAYAEYVARQQEQQTLAA